MMAFDIDQIHTQIQGNGFELSVPDAGGTAYIRLTPQLRDFFLRCHKERGVIGFDYDFEEGSLNFGLILKKRNDDDAQSE